MPATHDEQAEADGDAPGPGDSDGVGYISPDDSQSDTQVPDAHDPSDPLRSAPLNVAQRPASGQYDRAAARRATIAPVLNRHIASRRLRDLAKCILASALQFGGVSGRRGTLGKMWRDLCILQRHGHQPVEERVNGRVANDDIECGNDSNGIVALTPDRLGGHGDDCAVVHEV